MIYDIQGGRWGFAKLGAGLKDQTEGVIPSVTVEMHSRKHLETE